MTLQPAQPIAYGFLLVPGFTMIGFASAIEPLRMANLASGKTIFRMLTISENGEAVAGSVGVRLLVDHSLNNAPELDAVFVCGSNPIRRTEGRPLLNWLRQQAHQGTALGGICTGSYILARAALLNGYRCTIHWEDFQSLVEEFPEIIVSSKLFEIDRDRYTCSGGVAPVDMMIKLIRRLPQSRDLAPRVSELMVCERIRTEVDQQRVPLRQQLGTGRPKLTEAVALMEANIEEPMAVEELAHHLDLSRRQLERLFHDHLQCSPTSYYMKIRLQRARQLLLSSNESVLEIAAACGFVSANHFATRYRECFGLTPTQQRRKIPLDAASPPGDCRSD